MFVVVNKKRFYDVQAGFLSVPLVKRIKHLIKAVVMAKRLLCACNIATTCVFHGLSSKNLKCVSDII